MIFYLKLKGVLFFSKGHFIPKSTYWFRK